MTPNDQIKKQGWKEMKIILDNEMPIDKSKRRYILPFVLSVGFIVIVSLSLLWLTKNPATNKISKPEMDKNVTSTSTTSRLNESINATQNGTSEANVATLKIDKLKQKTNLNNITTENFEDKKTKKQNSIFKSVQQKNKDFQIQSKNSIFKGKTSSIKNELNPIVEITHIDNKEVALDLIVDSFQNERQRTFIAEIGNKVNFPISQKTKESLALPIQQILTSNPLTSKNYNFGVALGIGQNLTIKSNNSMQLGIFFEKRFGQEHGIILTSSIEMSRMDLKIKIDTMNSSLSTQLENSIGNSNNQNLDSYFKVNTFNPGFLLQSTGNLSYIRHLNNKFFFQGGIEVSYLIDIQEKDNSLENDRNFGVPNQYAKYSLNKLQNIIYNKWDIAPTFCVGFKFTQNISISAQYKHGLISLLKYPIGSNDDIYFRNLQTKINYTF